MTVAAQISPEKARKAAQVFAKNFYHHHYYLSAGEKYPSSMQKRPRSKSDYAIYNDIFPSTRTISDYKHSQSLQKEQDAAYALKNKTGEQRSLLHFDTTSRSRIDGEWPCLILNILSKPKISEKYTLRPLFFALEDRENIANLIVETLHRMSITVSLTAKILWEKIDG